MPDVWFHVSRILVTGATGYVGGRLVPRLLERGRDVRVLVRDASRLEGRSWQSQVEIVRGNVLEPEATRAALEGVSTAYYLIHSLGGGRGFHRRDIEAARCFSQSAREAGVERIIYLGGLGNPGSNLSPHLRSRQETGQALREAGVPVTEFRAAVIVGSGSLSFEMVRYLTERLPVMICPRWVYTRIQPIAIRNVIDYLVATLESPESIGRTLEIGGSDVLTYADMMLEFAAARGLKRRLLPVPLLTPRLSSYWVHLVTPIPASIARPLIRGLENEVIVRDDTARKIFPDIRPLGYREAVERALGNLESGEVESAWTDAQASSDRGRVPVTLETREGMILEQRQLVVETPGARVFAAFASLGGKRGWLYLNSAWILRGAVDRLIGGVGLRRGRRSDLDLRPGDALDFWRVEAVERDRLLRLRAEMRVPGRAWLQFEAKPLEEGGTLLVQTAYFAPRGLGGLLYWYALYPIHGLIFSGLIRNLARLAARREG